MPTVCERSSCVSMVQLAGGKGPKKDEKIKGLRMSLPILESLSGLQESVFSLFRGLQLNSRKKIKKISNYIQCINFPVFPLFGVPWAAVITFELENLGL